MLGIDHEVSLFPNTKYLNLIIEDFHSKQFREQLIRTRAKCILVNSEFLSNKKHIQINEFGSEKFLTQLGLGISVLKGEARVKEYLINIKKERFPIRDNYWRQRRKGLQELFEREVFSAILSLHPSAVSDFMEFPIESRTLYPVLSRRKPIPTSLNILVTMGSMSTYRRQILLRLNKELPLGIQHIREHELNSDNYDKDNIRIVDLYIRNRSNWIYSSPVRISRSINQGREVVLFDNRDATHPITNTCVNIKEPSELAKIEQLLYDSRKKRIKAIEEYNQIATTKNRHARDLILKTI